MDRKGQAGAGLAVGAMIGIVTLIVLVVVGLEISDAMRETNLGDEYTKANATGTYGTDFNTTRTVNLTLTRAVTDTAGVLLVTYDATASVTNITVGSTAIGTLTAASPESFAVPAALMDTSAIRFTFSVPGGGALSENMTEVNLTYTQYGGCTAYYDLCESANASVNMTNASFTILPVMAVLIAAAAVIGALMLFGGRR